MGALTNLLLVLVACLGLFAGGAYWRNAALREAFLAGEAAAREKASEDQRKAIAQQTSAAEATLEDARLEAADMERRHEKLQEALDGLEQELTSRTGPPGGCLASDVVRRLDALGRDPVATDRAP